MPEIYADDWYQAMVELCNSREDLSAKVPAGEYKFAIEIEGDGKSPYIPEGTTKHFFLILNFLVPIIGTPLINIYLD